MYLTQTELAKLRIKEGQTLSTTELIKDLIEKDRSSQEKIDMQKGEDYYLHKQDILNKDFRTYYNNGKSFTDNDKANNKIVHGFHKLLVDQKAGFIVGKPPTFTASAGDVEMLQTEDFHDLLNDWVTHTSNKGVEYLHPYISKKQELEFTIIPATEIIPVYDTNYNSTLMEIIRYYNIEYVADGKSETRTKVEWWDENEVKFYIETSNGYFVEDVSEEFNPRPHYLETNTATNKMVGQGWGQVPFIELPNNTMKTSDLASVKSMVDDYDLNVSEFSNNLSDIQEAVWKLKGYEGTDLQEFRRNLKTYKTIKLSEGGDADTKTIDIPKDARDSHLDRLEENIYLFGQGVNMKTDKFGNSPSGIALKFLYGLLELKVNQLERKLQKALKTLTKFIGIYTDEEIKDFEVKFDYSMMMNITEIVDNLQKSKGIVSDETLIEEHPFVKDVERELERVKNEEPEVKIV